MAQQEGYVERFETYLQSHVHPDVQPQARREVQLDHVTMETFLRLAGIFEANQEAIEATQQGFEQRRVDL